MNLTQIKKALTELLQRAPGLSGLEVLPAFPAQRHLPLPGPVIVLGIDGLELSPGSLSGLSGEPSGGLVSVTIRLDFFAPGEDGPDLHLLYEALCAALIEKGSAFGLSRVWCDPLRWDDAAGAYRLGGRALLRGRAKGGGSREESPSITGFRLRISHEMGEQKDVR